LTPERIEQAVDWFRDEQQLEVFESQDGFEGIVVGVDWISGRAMAISLWESEAAMRKSERAANRARTGAVDAGGGVREQIVDRYEVVTERFPARKASS
jgi:hypothetical protein